MPPSHAGSLHWTTARDLSHRYVPVYCLLLEEFRMNRVLVLGIAMFFAVVGIALVGGEKSSAVAGLGCHGCNGCGGGLCSGGLFNRNRCCGDNACCGQVADCCGCRGGLLSRLCSGRCNGCNGNACSGNDCCGCRGGLFHHLRNRCCGNNDCCGNNSCPPACCGSGDAGAAPMAPGAAPAAPPAPPAAPAKEKAA